MKAIVIGAGVGGLTTAALLAKRGCEVTVLEAHVEPGGCAATFFHKGNRFDVGATLVGGFHPGGQVASVVDNRAEIEERVVKHADDHHLEGLKVLPMRTAAAAV